jgi:hypothetical protein
MKLGTRMPDGKRRKPIDIEVCRTKVKVATSKNSVYQVSFRSDISFLRYCAETIGRLDAIHHIISRVKLG